MLPPLLLSVLTITGLMLALRMDRLLNEQAEQAERAERAERAEQQVERAFYARVLKV
jgi:hypothetical protein